MSFCCTKDVPCEALAALRKGTPPPLQIQPAIWKRGLQSESSSALPKPQRATAAAAAEEAPPVPRGKVVAVTNVCASPSPGNSEKQKQFQTFSKRFQTSLDAQLFIRHDDNKDVNSNKRISFRLSLSSTTTPNVRILTEWSESGMLLCRHRHLTRERPQHQEPPQPQLCSPTLMRGPVQQTAQMQPESPGSQTRCVVL